jgi:hypothetical protein
MPVSYTDRASIENFIIPAPLVSISKNYDTTGDGNIIGTRYSIILTGVLTADRGSPTNDGDFYTSSVDTPYIPSVADEEWYRSIQKKQKALSNLFSRENEGGELHLLPPEDPQSVQGLRCYPRILSVEFPEQTGGAPSLCNYTITLECDRLVGYKTDKDGHQAANEDFKYLVSSADETWTIDENDTTQIELKGTGVRTGHFLADHANYKYVSSAHKVYVLTHTLTATGKRRYDESNIEAGNLAVDGTIAGLATSTDNTEDGEAWQQARGFILNKISNSGKTTRVSGYQTENGVLGTDKQGFIGVDGISLPNTYKGYDYKRIQNVDKSGGSFSVTETWLLLNSTVAIEAGVSVADGNGENPVVETMEVTQSTSKDDGLIAVEINGSIEGLAIELDWETGGSFTLPVLPATPSENPNALKQYDSDQPAQTSIAKYKFEQAQRRITYLWPYLYQIAHKAVAAGGTDPANQLAASPIFTNTSLNPIPVSKSIVRNPTQGTVNYSVSFDNRASTCIPGALNETVTIEDSQPHHVFAETPVIGRRRGPVFQDIGTQSAWRRTLTIEVQVSGILHGCNWTTAMRGKPSNVVSINGNTDYDQQDAIRTIISTISPQGIIGVDVFAVGPSDPTETWDPISGNYTYRIEWTYSLFEGAGTRGGALGHSYLGNVVFQYPRTATNVNAGLGTTPPGVPW